MSTELAVGIVVFSLLGIAVMAVSCWDRKLSDSQIRAEKERMEFADKAFKTIDDSNEPARWVP